MKKVAFSSLSWVTGGGHAAQTAALGKAVTGKCTRMDVIANAVTGNPTLTVAIIDTDNNGTYFTVAAIPDGTHSILLAESGKGTQDADFNPTAFFNDKLTVSVDPSADPGGSTETLTVTVSLVLED